VEVEVGGIQLQVEVVMVVLSKGGARLWVWWTVEATSFDLHFGVWA
jgi:hypothetical protein